MRTILVALLVTLPVLAGCVTPPDPADPAAATAFIDPIVEDHDHSSFADHALWTPSMSLVGHSAMADDGKPFSYIGEMDTFGNLTVVQILGRGSIGGFVILDTSDPTNPTPIGRAEMPFSYVVDVKFSPDGQRIFAASQAGAQGTRGHDPITSDPVNAGLQGNGFTEWDVSDPTNPVAVAGGLAAPSGCHMLSVQDIGNERYVFCIHDAVLIYQYTEGGAWSQVSAFGPGTTTSGAMQVAGEAVAAGPGAANTLLLGATPHDLTIQKDPLDETRLIASVSYWDFGVRFYDVSNPMRPIELGAWSGQGAEVYEGNVHGAMLSTHEGKRIAVVGPELLGSTVPAMWVLDLDDISSPVLMAEWVPPNAHISQGLLLTVHQFQLVGDRIYLAYNHAGLWVLDLPTIIAGTYVDDPTHPEVLGYYLPHQEVELYDPDTAAVPNTWDVNVKDGYIFASDRYTGFYVLHYEGDTPGDAAITSFA